jgi:hypothetical protein
MFKDRSQAVRLVADERPVPTRERLVNNADSAIAVRVHVNCELATVVVRHRSREAFEQLARQYNTAASGVPMEQVVACRPSGYPGGGEAGAQEQGNKDGGE